MFLNPRYGSIGMIAMPFFLIFEAFGPVVEISGRRLVIEGRAFARYPGWRDLRRLMVAAVVENFGYRQWLAVVRTKALRPC